MFFCKFVAGKKKKKSTTNTALLRQQSFTFFPQQMTFAVDCNGSCSTSDGKGACSQPGLLAPAEDCWTSIGNPHFFSPPASLCSTHALQKKQGDPCVYRMVQRMWGASRGVFLAGLTVAPHLEVGTVSFVCVLVWELQTTVVWAFSICVNSCWWGPLPISSSSHLSEPLGGGRAF